MSLFQDTQDLYHLNWYSSPWKPYYNKLTSRTLDEDSGDSESIKVWCAEEELKGKLFTITVVGNSGNDHIASIAMSGGTTIETDNFETSEHRAHDDRTVKWWYGPGVALQFRDGIHSTNGYTSAATVYTHRIVESDIGEKVYDGGIHCWMKLPHNPQGGGVSAATDVYSKNIPMEYINSEDFLMVFNSYGHLPITLNSANVGLTVSFQNAYVPNPEAGQFVTEGIPTFDDIDLTSSDVNASYMATAVITDPGFANRQNARSLRFLWYTEDDTGTEAIYHGGQFIRVSLYPING